MDLVSNNSATNLHAILDDLIAKHKSNEYVYGRLLNYIENLLPVALDNATALNIQREARRNTLSANRDEFTTRFLQKNNYYYSPPTELFLHYDGLHFVIRKEDDIYHQILSTITSEKCLRDWRHKVNKNIIKRIKERSPLKAIPESVTIQFVFNTLCPSIFKTRNHVKYFLSIVGECLFKKKQWDQMVDTSANEMAIQSTNNTTIIADLIYIFPPALKEIIREIGNQCYTLFGLPNIFTNIKFKYYDHNYNNCRLISITQKKIETPPMLIKHMLDFLCVAAHYHVRYGSGDKFLQRCNDSVMVEHALFLSKNTQESIVSTFIEKSVSLSPNGVIDTKNMLFIWKKYLDERNIPNIIFYETLKTILKKKLNYDETNDCFLGVTSIHLPIVALFMRFWEETIVFTADTNSVEWAGAAINELTGAATNEWAGAAINELAGAATYEEAGAATYEEAGAATNEWAGAATIEYSELEIDEICVLFKSWTNGIKNINEGLVVEIIQHFYPDMVIENNKYILNATCKLWDKHAEVINSLNSFKKQYSSMDTDLDLDVDLDLDLDLDVYAFYCTQSKNKYNLLVSKRFFEKTASDTILNELNLVFP
jgi:hypothetical protein